MFFEKIRAAAALAAGALLVAASASAQPAAAPSTVEVQAGDTFSAIAARFIGNSKSWRQLYDASRSGLPDPNLIRAGSRLELVTEASGTRYLRVVGGDTPAVVASRATTPARTSAPAATAATAAQAPAPAPTRPVAGAPPPPAPAAPPAPPAAPADETLVLGVLPNIAPGTLLAQYESLKRYLERLNPQKVRVVVPPTFKAFVDAQMRGDYDLAVSAPHFARMAQADRNMIPLVMYEPRINGLFVVPLDSPVTGPRDVRDKVVAFANPQSLVAMYGVQWLRQGNLEAGKDYEAKAGRTDMGVGRMMLTGEAAAAVMSNGELRALPADESGRLRVVEVVARIPNFVIIAHPRVDRDRVARLKAQLKTFLADPEDGVPFAKASGVTGIIDADESQLRELDPYLAQTRRSMGYAP